MVAAAVMWDLVAGSALSSGSLFSHVGEWSERVGCPERRFLPLNLRLMREARCVGETDVADVGLECCCSGPTGLDSSDGSRATLDLLFLGPFIEELFLPSDLTPRSMRQLVEVCSDPATLEVEWCTSTSIRLDSWLGRSIEVSLPFVRLKRPDEAPELTDPSWRSAELISCS
jgi:hypothetical protein